LLTRFDYCVDIFKLSVAILDAERAIVAIPVDGFFKTVQFNFVVYFGMAGYVDTPSVCNPARQTA
jgi:hypothetical protein